MPNEYFSTTQEITKTADAIRRKKRDSNLIEWKNNTGFQDAINSIEDTVVYGFHVNSNESDPSAAVTYLADAIGKTPAHMDYDSGIFDYGSWENAFFMPRPCMLQYDGTVDYYLDPNDYSKKLDGTASDVADDTYSGNAMMEWGRDGKQIWYKIVPDANDNTSASVYIADSQVDENYRAWSFINNQGVLVDHFYTPIYNGSVDSNARLRSISGKDYSVLCKGMQAATEVVYAKRNNLSGADLWYTEVYADVTLINLLLILVAKSLDSQTTYGNGRCGQGAYFSNMISTGTLNDRGLFFGYNNGDHAVKVFGMENWWGNQFRRYAGHIMLDNYVQKYKMTRGRQDGSTADDYSQSDIASDYDGYLTGATGPNTIGFAQTMQFDKNGFFQTKAVGGTYATYWADYWFLYDSGTCYASRGGACLNSVGNVGAFYNRMADLPVSTFWFIGAAPSCKPLATSE